MCSSDLVISGVDFLKQINLGNGQKLSGNVVVIGGGNVAVDVARAAVRQGAAKVSMISLEKADEMPALPEEIEEAEAEGIEIINSWGPHRIIIENGKASAVELKKCVSVFEDGKFSPKYDICELKKVPADYVITSIGQSVEWGELLNYTTVELNANGTAIADELTYQTADPDIFVGGDIYTGPKFAIDAIAAGKQAAISLHRFVQPGQSLTIGRDRRNFKPLDKDNVDKDAVIQGYDNTPRQRPAYDIKKKNSYEEDRKSVV